MSKHYKKLIASDLHYTPASDYHPANTYFHFSFANYNNPDKMNFGALRVFNDDDIRPISGFDKHPHRDVEIVSYIVSGELTHWDSVTGVEDVIKRGHVQTITAGAGLWHSELNNSNGWTRILQVWFLPPAKRLPVRYNNHAFTLKDRENTLLHIVGNLDSPESISSTPLSVNQDVNLYVSEMTKEGAIVRFDLQAGRQAYVNNFEGVVDVKDIASLGERDSLEIVGPATLEFKHIGENAHFIIIEMAETR